MLLLKLIVAPVLILLVSLAERKWGTVVSGLLVGFPMTSGLILYFLALEQGANFSARTSIGSLLSLTAFAAFSFVYGRFSRSCGWLLCVAAGITAYVAGAFLLGMSSVKTGAGAFGLACFALIGARLSFSHTRPNQPDVKTLGNRELVLRMATAAALVFSLTALADVLGPVPSGLIAGFPIYSSILAVFNHMKSSAMAISVLRGIVTGAFGGAVFFVIVALLLGKMSTGSCFMFATCAAVSTQAILFPTLR
jgi:uncharacterized membrane protein (GlpM family)